MIPLEHGHLTNMTVYESKIAERAATKLQNIWRGKKNREKSEHVARVQAFQQARRVATQTAKERVEKDFRNKELLTGVKRHTWDAKVRIFQTRKKAEGMGMDRDAAVGSRRFEVLRRLHFLGWTRVHLTMSWVVSFSISMRRAGTVDGGGGLRRGREAGRR